jgi:hypothetical protein
LNRRLVTSATLVIQIAGLTLLAWAPSAVGVYTVCALFGLGVGNLTTLPGLTLPSSGRVSSSARSLASWSASISSPLPSDRRS